MRSTSPRTMRSISSSQSMRSWRSSSSSGLHSSGAPTRRAASGMVRSPSTGIHRTRCSLCRTWLLSQVTPLLPVNGATQTKVVSSGRPRLSMGIVLSSTPSAAKSCSGLLPALAPSHSSSRMPVQPLSRFRSRGMGIPASAASSPSE